MKHCEAPSFEIDTVLIEIATVKLQNKALREAIREAAKELGLKVE